MRISLRQLAVFEAVGADGHVVLEAEDVDVAVELPCCWRRSSGCWLFSKENASPISRIDSCTDGSSDLASGVSA